MVSLIHYIYATKKGVPNGTPLKRLAGHSSHDKPDTLGTDREEMNKKKESRTELL